MTAAARLLLVPTPNWEEAFLEWFGRQSGVDLFEFERSIGGFRYHQFVARFKDEKGQSRSSFGRSQDRTIAAVKCAAECIERKTMLEFFSGGGKILPKELHTSNGWAVHRSAIEAKTAAMQEALERHLLLKSFLKNDWSGFDLVNRITHEKIEIFFLRSICQTKDTAAGLVIAKSPLHSGISIGQCVGHTSQLGSFRFWESGVFEAVDRILTLNGQSIDASADSKSWILGRSKELLETPFDFSNLTENHGSEIEPDIEFRFDVFDLSAKYATAMSLFAAFAHAPTVIPLFPSFDLQLDTETCLRSVFARNGLSNLSFPVRHPIL